MEKIKTWIPHEELEKIRLNFSRHTNRIGIQKKYPRSPFDKEIKELLQVFLLNCWLVANIFTLKMVTVNGQVGRQEVQLKDESVGRSSGRQADRQVQVSRYGGKEGGREGARQVGRWVGRQVGRQVARQVGREVGRQVGRWVCRQVGSWVGRYIQREKKTNVSKIKKKNQLKSIFKEKIKEGILFYIVKRLEQRCM